jgi:hypothetical protein
MIQNKTVYTDGSTGGLSEQRGISWQEIDNERLWKDIKFLSIDPYRTTPATV